MNIRQPARAGSFYEASASSCRHHAERLISSADVPDDLPARLFGGLVPHAGWTFSGSIAALTLKALHAAAPLERVVLFGADHVGTVRRGELYDSGVWRTPLGDAPVDEELAGALLQACDAMRPNPDAHAMEHSLEVQVPLLQALSPSVRIVPVAVPPDDIAIEIGRTVGETLTAKFPGVRVIGSTDLTHHGGHFGHFGAPGEEGVKWTEQNDRRMIDLVESLSCEQVVAEAAARRNACGAGAIAATTAACRAMGATRGICLKYDNSHRIVREKFPYETDDTTVGYASVVFA